MKKLINHKKGIYTGSIIAIFILNIFFIIQSPILINKANKDDKMIEDVLPFNYHTSNSPPNSNYFQYYKDIIINHSKVSGSIDLINFPLLISLIDSDLHDDVQEDGDDIAFSNGTIWLDHEIEFFNQTFTTTHAKLLVWVRVPSLSPVIDTKIIMYYGNSTMSSRQNAIAVWDNNYVGVWHLADDPTGNILDSTSYSNYGTSYGSMSSDDQIFGKIDGSIELDGSDDYIDCGNPAEFQITGSITVETWFKADYFGNDYLINKNGPSGQRGWDLSFDPINSTHGYVMFRYALNGKMHAEELGNITISINNWYHLVGVFNPSTYSRLFINGQKLAENTTNIISSQYDAPNPVRFGARGDSIPADFINGIIDEVRISNAVRSADWIITEYNNQYNPQNFYNVSLEKTPDSSPPNYSDLIESSDPLELGDTEVIIINVTDPSGINQVNFEFEGSNHSMTNIYGNTWQYNSWIPISVGNYSYTIWMEDNYNNWNSTIGSIEVIDTTPPTYSNLIESADPLQLGQNETISIKVYDSPGSGVNQVLLEYDSLNHTMDFMGGNTWAWSNWRPSSGGVYPYKIYMQDMENNWNETTGIITVISTTAPFIENLTESADPLELGDYITITVDVYDNETSVSTVLIELEGVNNTMSYIGGNSYEYNWTWFLVGTVNYKIYANDTDNNWNSLSDSFDIVDTTLPNFIALLESEDPLEFGNNEIISINCTDLTGIKQVLIEFEGFNHSMSNVNGDTWQYSIWSPSTTGNHSYTIWIEDNFNNWNYTIGSILVQDKTPPSYSNLIESADPVELGTPLTISIITNDLSDVDQVLIEFEGSNHSMFYFGGDLWRYDSWLPNIIGIYTYTIHMRDNYDNWNSTTDSITFQDTISPTYTNLIENVDPLELGNSVNIRVTVNDYAGINRTLIEFEGNNHSMVNIGGYLWEYNSWTPTNLIVYQYIIHMEDNSGNWNSVIGNITVQDTTPPLAPVITNSPSGDINGILTFDWLDGSDPSGILYYILIIDNETNPFTTPGYVYFFNITNLGTQSSYLEISETPPLGRYYFFLYQIDGVGHQSDYTMGTFTIVSNVNGNPPANDSLIFIIIGIILAILIGSTVAIILVRKRVQKTVIPRRKKIPLKVILRHVNKISNLQFTSETNKFLKGEISNQKNKVISNQGLIDEEQIEVDLVKIKAFGEELFNNGAYLEAQKQFEFAKNMLMKLGRNEEAKLFSDLFQGISGLIEKRENLLKVLDKVKVEDNVVKLFELYYDLIQISKKLRDLDAQDMYRSEFIESLQNNNLALSGLEEHRLIMEDQIKVENNSAKVVELYEKCEIISEFLIQLGREEEKINLDKFRNKKFEFLGEK